MQKYNSVVFPFTRFNKLNDLRVRDNFVGKKVISLNELRALLPSGNFSKLMQRGGNPADKIFNLFLHPQIRFGPKRFVLEKKSHWLAKINGFVKSRRPLLFTILGFPGKAPVPLKTNRSLPDFGEILALQRLFDLTQIIKKIYKPGAKVIIVTEGVLGDFIGLDPQETRAYEKQLAFFAKKLGWHKALDFLPLRDLTKLKNFEVFFKKNISLLKRGKNRSAAQKKFQAAFNSVFHLVNCRGFALDIIADAYQTRPKTKKGRHLRNQLIQKASQAVWQYLAFLKTRDDLRFLEKRASQALALTVSPKPYRLGFNLVSKTNKLLPHHGVPLGTEIRYLIDIRRSNKKFIQIYLKADKENLPFLYLLKK